MRSARDVVSRSSGTPVFYRATAPDSPSQDVCTHSQGVFLILVGAVTVAVWLAICTSLGIRTALGRRSAKRGNTHPLRRVLDNKRCHLALGLLVLGIASAGAAHRLSQTER